MRLEDLLIGTPETTNPPTIQESYNETDLELPEYLITDPQVVGYPDVEMQSDIYTWVYNGISPINLNGLPSSIKDYGSGRGDFYGKLIASNQNVNYIGFDFKETMVLAGQKKYPGIELIYGNYLDSDLQTDYTICIGTLNDDHGLDKWDHFNKTLSRALETTNIAIIFVLSSNFDGLSGYLDYPIAETIEQIPNGTRYELDYSKFEDIYKLTIHIGGYN